MNIQFPKTAAQWVMPFKTFFITAMGIVLLGSMINFGLFAFAKPVIVSEASCTVKAVIAEDGTIDFEKSMAECADGDHVTNVGKHLSDNQRLVVTALINRNQPVTVTRTYKKFWKDGSNDLVVTLNS